MVNPGKLFVLEGPDGVGKTALSQLVTASLSERGPCLRLSFPGRNPRTLGKLVHDLHHRHREMGVDAITPTSMQLLHVAAHLDQIERLIAPALGRGESVVLDRFWWSTWVYGFDAGADKWAIRAMVALEKAAWQKITPNHVFLITRKPPSSTAYDRILAAYRRLAAVEGKKYPVHLVDNDDPVAEVSARIFALCLSGPVSGSNGDLHQLPSIPSFSVGSGPMVFTRLAPAKPTVVYDTYWRFAVERQAIFFRRVRNEPPPWTHDPILRAFKFTNAYRASDRVSQYLIRNVIYSGGPSPEEMFFRIILFKIFNKIETWELLRREIGEVRWAEYDFSEYDRVLSEAAKAGDTIYSGAYIMPSGRGSLKSSKKHRTHLRLIAAMVADGLPQKLAEAPSMHRAFDLLRAYPTIGDFLGYQYVTDLNYSVLTDFDEMTFTVPGPGARDGIRKCFSDPGGLNEADLIRLVADRQEAEFGRLGLEFQSLWGRRLQLIDCQNLFCEVDKYARLKHPDIQGISGRTRIKQRFHATDGPLDVWYPPKWHLNEKIEKRSAEYVQKL